MSCIFKDAQAYSDTFFLFFGIQVWTQNKALIDTKIDLLPKDLSFLKSEVKVSYSPVQWSNKTREWQNLAIRAGYFLFTLQPEYQTDSVHYFRIDTGPFFQGILYQDSNSHTHYNRSSGRLRTHY